MTWKKRHAEDVQAERDESGWHDKRHDRQKTMITFEVSITVGHNDLLLQGVERGHGKSRSEIIRAAIDMLYGAVNGVAS